MTGQHLHERALRSGAEGTFLTIIGGIPVWGPPSGVQNLVPGDHIEIDDTDPANPVISAVLLVQLVAVVNGEPEFVWDENNEQVLMELIE